MINLKHRDQRKKIIKKLFKSIVKNYKVNKINFRIIDRDTIYDCSSIGSSYAKHKEDRHIIGINLLTLSRRVKEGYYNDYYPNRHERLKFVKGNRKLALRFVLLHELGHCILKEQNRNTELEADNFAIRQLIEEGLLYG